MSLESCQSGRSRTDVSRSTRVIASLSAEPPTGAVTSSGRRTSRRWWALVPAAIGAVILVTAAVVAPSVPAVGGSTANTDVVDVARRYEAALVEHDWDALEGLVADDFTLHYTEYGAIQHRRGFR